MKELNIAVKIMAKVQLNKDLSSSEISSIVKFLETLTGDIPTEAYLKPIGVGMKKQINERLVF